MRKILLGVIMALVLAPQLGFAWGPYTHDYINEQVLSDSRLSGSSIAQLINNNRQCYNSGFVATDISVIYYYTEGEKYEATHSWRFQKAMMTSASNDCERAFAYGIAAHLIQDSVAHNTFIPDKIRETMIPNAIIHPIEEAKIEAWIIKNEPAVFAQGQHDLDWLLSNPQMMDKMQNQIYSSSGIIMPVEEDVQLLADAMGNPAGFYTSVFSLPDIYEDFSKGNIATGVLVLLVSGTLLAASILLLRKSKHISVRVIAFVMFLAAVPILLVGILLSTGGITGWSSMADAEQYMDATIDRTVFIFQPANWESRINYDPTGFDSLEQADMDIGLYFNITVVIVIAALLAIGYFFFIRRRRR